MVKWYNLRSHRHSDPEYLNAYGGPSHADAHRYGYEHSHIDPACDRYKYPDSPKLHPPLG